MDLVLPLGTPGLAIEDAVVRLYGSAGDSHGYQPIDLPVGVALDATETGVDYVLSGLPEAPAGETRAVTYEFPPGVGFSRFWGAEAPPAVPSSVLVPLRESEAAGSIDAVVIRNGDLSDDEVSIDEVAGAAGDYVLSGWPTPAPGEDWTLRWKIGDVFYARDWSVPATPPDEGLPAETVVRRLLGSVWLKAWLGEALNEKRFCPARSLGFAGEESTWSYEDAGDVAPWTPAEVKATVGYALLRFRELDRFDVGLTSGAAVVDGQGRVTAQEYRLYALDFEFAVPSKLKGADPALAMERRRAKVESIFEGIALLPPEGTPVLSIRNLDRYPTRRRAGVDDGTWKRSYLTVQVRARVRKIYAGAMEATLP